MRKNILITLSLSICLLFHSNLLAQFSASAGNEIDLVSINVEEVGKHTYTRVKAKDVLHNMHENIYTIAAHSYRLQLEERRTGNVYHRGEMLINVKNEPLNIRMEVIKPNKGAVVEYNAKEDKSGAYITPKKWMPAVKFRRDINGTLLRPGHYSIDETSLGFIDNIIKQSEALFQKRGIYNKGVRYWGSLHVEGVACHKIELMDHEYKIINYRIRKGDNLIKIARKQVVNPYKIKELNPEIKTYYDVSPGQIIRIPSSYAKRCIVYVDTQNYLPRRLEVFDEEGWFERYSFFDIKVERE